MKKVKCFLLSEKLVMAQGSTARTYVSHVAEVKAISDKDFCRLLLSGPWLSLQSLYKCYH